MRGPIVSLLIAGTALAQSAPPPPGATIAPGIPFRVALERKTRVKKVGDPIRGHLLEPVYVFDRTALPAGTLVDGRIANIEHISFGKRMLFILSGNLTPPRKAEARFDRVLLGDGSSLSLAAAPSPGIPHTAAVAPRLRKGAAADTVARAGCPASLPSSAGKLSWLTSRAIAMFPYHRQSWPKGTVFSAVVQEQFAIPRLAPEPSCPSLAASATQQVRARLVNSITSATARKGDRVEALVTRPLFSAEHALLIPEGARLVGEVLNARPARFLHRNGKLLFTFREISMPSGATQQVQGNVEALEADAAPGLMLDSEGGVRVNSPKTRFIFPAISAVVAGLSVHQDYNSQGIPDQDIAGRAESGAMGFGLIGTVLAQTSRPLASIFAFSGAGLSFYSTFIARGTQIALPANTPLEVSLHPERQSIPRSRTR